MLGCDQRTENAIAFAAKDHLGTVDRLANTVDAEDTKKRTAMRWLDTHSIGILVDEVEEEELAEETEGGQGNYSQGRMIGSETINSTEAQQGQA